MEINPENHSAGLPDKAPRVQADPVQAAPAPVQASPAPVSYTHLKYVQRGDPLELWIKGSYPLSCLRPLGKTWSAPLRIKLTGLAHTYLRGL